MPAVARRALASLAAVALFQLLTACGGGSDGGGPPTDAGRDGAPAGQDTGGDDDAAPGPDARPCDAAPDGARDAAAPADAAADAVGDTATAADTAPVPDVPVVPDVPPAPDTAGDADAVPDVPADVPPDVPPTIGQRCFPELYHPGEPGPNYDQFAPVIADHCWGTNHQDITGIEKVVFLGDSVTVGTPNTAHLLSGDNGHFYRNLLAEWLATHFGLDRGNLVDWGLWKTYDYFSGKGGRLESGDFRNCAKWGARTDDFLDGGSQVPECFPAGGSPYRTLVVFTMGGNDIAKITQEGAAATPEEVAAGYPEEWALAERAIEYLEDAVTWFKDPGHFPAGADIIFVNGFEFTDATGETDSCSPRVVLEIPWVGTVDLSQWELPVAGIAGYGSWQNPEAQQQMVMWMLEQYMRIAVEHRVDVIWTLEKFCGHGYVATGPNADAENRCYLGPDSDLWYDESCIHPSEAGHRALFEMFQAVVLE